MASARANASSPRNPDNISLGLASNALRRQDKIGAAVILLRSLRNNPHLIPDRLQVTLDIFVEAINVAGLEQELLDVIVLCKNPATVLGELYESLESARKPRAIESIERMRRRHTVLHALDLPYVPLPAPDPELISQTFDTISSEHLTTPTALDSQHLEYAYATTPASRSSSAHASPPYGTPLNPRSPVLAVPTPPPAAALSACALPPPPPTQTTPPPTTSPTTSNAHSTPSTPSPPPNNPAPAPSSLPAPTAAPPARSASPPPPSLADWAPSLASSISKTHARLPDPESAVFASVTESAVLAALCADENAPHDTTPAPTTTSALIALPKAPTSEFSSLSTAPDSFAVEAAASATRRARADQQAADPTDASANSVSQPLDVVPLRRASTLRESPAAISKGRRRLHLTAALVSVLMAGGAYTFIAKQTTSLSTQRAQLNEARSLGQTRAAPDLARARDLCLGIFQGDTNHHEAAAWAFFFDRTLASTFHETPAIDAAAWPVIVRTDPLFVAGQILDLLADPADTNRGKAALTRIDSFDRWDDRPGLRDWLLGRALLADRQFSQAAAAFAKASDTFELSLWPLLDLGMLALQHRQPDAMQAFVTRAMARSNEHFFLRFAPSVASLSLLEPPRQDALIDLTPEMSGALTHAERAWMLLAAAHQAFHAQQPEHARALVERGLQSQSLPELDMLLGILHLTSQHPEEAAASFTDALDQMPADARLRAHRSTAATLLREAARPDLVLQVLLPTWHPGDALDASLSLAELALAGDALLQTGQSEAVIRFALQAKSQQRSSDDLTRLHWLAARRMGRPDTELAQIAKSFSHPADAPALLTAFDRRLPEMHFEDAFSEAQRLAASFPTNPEVLALRLELMGTAGDGAQASALALASSQHLPIHARAQILSALALSRSSGLPIDQASAALATPTSDLYLIQAQAEIAWRAGISDRAAALLAQAKTLDPSSPWTLAIQGLMPLHTEAEDAKAIVLFERGLQGPRSLPGLHFNLAQRYHRLGKITESAAAYQLAMAKPSDREQALDQMSRMLVDAKRLQSGRRILERLLTVYPPKSHDLLHARIQMWMGVMYAPWSGDKEAFVWLERAHKTLGEQSATLLFYLGWYHEATLRKTAAIDHYKRALAVDPHLSPANARLTTLTPPPP